MTNPKRHRPVDRRLRPTTRCGGSTTPGRSRATSSNRTGEELERTPAPLPERDPHIAGHSHENRILRPAGRTTRRPTGRSTRRRSRTGRTRAVRSRSPTTGTARCRSSPSCSMPPCTGPARPSRGQTTIRRARREPVSTRQINESWLAVTRSGRPRSTIPQAVDENLRDRRPRTRPPTATPSSSCARRRSCAAQGPAAGEDRGPVSVLPATGA